MDGDDRLTTSRPSTAEERVELVRRLMDAFNRRDMDAMLEVAAPNFEYDFTRSMGPLVGVYRGLEGFKEFANEQWTMFEDFEIEALEFIPRGNHVVVPMTIRATGRGGVPVSANSAQLYTFEDGRIVRITMFQGREEALAAAG